MTAPAEWVRVWKPAVRGVHEVFHARFLEHAYPRHAHDAWTVFLVDDGSIAYDLDRLHRGAAGGRVTILPPHLVHDGRAATPSGYTKRVLYLAEDLLGERSIGPSVDEPDIGDPRVVGAVRRLHRVLREPAEAFEAETRLALVVDALRAHLGDGRHEHDAAPGDRLADEYRALLDSTALDSRVTLSDAAAMLHASPGHLVRSFANRFAISPHRYLVSARIDGARRRLLEGEPPAEVATGVGFFDQAHLTRHFKRHVGTTPAAFASGRRSPAPNGSRAAVPRPMRRATCAAARTWA
jgi:AraC-like DNA-binding protein